MTWVWNFPDSSARSSAIQIVRHCLISINKSEETSKHVQELITALEIPPHHVSSPTAWRRIASASKIQQPDIGLEGTGLVLSDDLKPRR